MADLFPILPPGVRCQLSAVPWLCIPKVSLPSISYWEKGEPPFTFRALGKGPWEKKKTLENENKAKQIDMNVLDRFD